MYRKSLVLFYLVAYVALIATCAQFTVDDCVKGPQELPPCSLDIPIYTWDNEKRACVQASYGGCNHTLNAFRSLELCKKVAKPICERGRPFTLEDCGVDVQEHPKCGKYISRWSWDSELEKCVIKIYGGCNPTQNNFATSDECESIAGKVCPGKSFFSRTDCSKPVEEFFPCKVKAEVYTWNNAQQSCVPTVYGGCRATKNNFVEKEDCERIATPVCKREKTFTKQDCTELPEPGKCKGLFKMYRWNDSEKQCILYHNGGCGDSANAFANIEDCETIAGVICQN